MPAALEPYRQNFVWRAVKAFARIFFAVRFRYRTRGAHHVPRRGGALLLMNHQSFLDPVLVGAAMSRPVSYLARRNLFEIPVVGWVLRKTYVIPLDRGAVSPSTIKEAVQRMRDGFLVGIYPEGTRTLDGSVGEFQPGFLTLVRRAGVPVIPVGIAGAFEAYPRDVKFPRHRTIRTIIGAPLGAETMALLERRENDRFLEIARDRVVSCYEQATEWRRMGSSRP